MMATPSIENLDNISIRQDYLAKDNERIWRCVVSFSKRTGTETITYEKTLYSRDIKELIFHVGNYIKEV